MSEHKPELAPLVERPAHVAQERVVDFDVYAPPGGKHDLYGSWLSLRKPSIPPDLAWTPRNGGHWIATSGRVVSSAYADYKRFSTKCVILPKEVGRHYQVIPNNVDPPAHQKYRMLLSSGLTPKTVAGIQENVRELARTLIDGFKPRGWCNFSTEFAEQLPIRVFLNLVDLPHELAPEIRDWVTHVMMPDPDVPFDQNMKRIVDFMASVADQRRGGDGKDFISHMVNGQIDKRPLSAREAAEMGAQVLVAGMDTVVNMLGLIMHYLATNPALRRKLVENPELIAPSIEEFIRRFPVAAIAREVIDDMTYEGVEMKQGDMILLPTILHGLDERENERPMEFDLQRTSFQHSTFGNGVHKCPGAHLARTEIQIMLEEWLPRIPDFSVDPDTPITYSSGVVGRIDHLKLVWPQ